VELKDTNGPNASAKSYAKVKHLVKSSASGALTELNTRLRSAKIGSKLARVDTAKSANLHTAMRKWKKAHYPALPLALEVLTSTNQEIVPPFWKISGVPTALAVSLGTKLALLRKFTSASMPLASA
jgi:hypothetical protein